MYAISCSDHFHHHFHTLRQELVSATTVEDSTRLALELCSACKRYFIIKQLFWEVYIHIYCQSAMQHCIYIQSVCPVKKTALFFSYKHNVFFLPMYLNIESWFIRVSDWSSSIHTIWSSSQRQSTAAYWNRVRPSMTKIKILASSMIIIIVISAL